MSEISLETFIKVRQDCIRALDNIQAKADTLQKAYTCFQEIIDAHTNVHTKRNTDYDKKWDKNIRKPADKNERVERHRIGGRGEISKEDHIKRDFLAFVNRLSDANRKNIQTYFENTFQIDFIDLYIKLLWEAMLRCGEYQAIYIDCFEAIFNLVTNADKQNIFLTKIVQLWTKYYNEQKWLPSEELINEEDYDDFCDFVKWKKTSLTYIDGFSKFVLKEWLSVSVYRELLSELLKSIDLYLEKTPEGCKVTDALIEKISTLIKHIKIDYNEYICQYIDKLNANATNYRPSTRFKIYDLIDYMRNNSYINV